jgi:C4-dicarboxylate-specific signal transduction histidine kinase
MKKTGLKYILIRLQLTLSIVVLLISWSLITINDYQLFRNLSIQTFETTGRVLARNLSTCLAFKDQEECQRVLNSISGEEGVLKAIVTDKDKNVISSFIKNPGQFIADVELKGDGFQVEIHDNQIHASYSIYDMDTLEGTLSLVAEFDLIKTFLKRHAIYFVFIILVSMFIAMLLSSYFQRKVTAQINRILETINNIKKLKAYNLRTLNDDNLGQVEIEEFRQLASSFDDMIEQVEVRDRSLQLRNEDLERLVEEKAQELYKEKEKLLHNAELASLGEMAGGIAHEINNPLAIIKGSTTSLNKMVSKDRMDKEIFLDCLSDIDKTVERIAKIITGLRNISRRSDGGDKSVTTFQDIFDDVFGVATVKFKAAGIEVKHNYNEEDLKKKFMTNRVQLSQVLVNLLNNAYDAISPLEDKWIEVEIAFTEKKIIMKLTDSGSGIPADVRKKMFNPFYTTKEIGKGTGIGLSISKSMIEKNGGSFYYDENCTNTRFVIELPFEKEAE